MSDSNEYQEKAQEFLRVSPQFRLGGLVTEQPHPLSENLSSLAESNLGAALDILHRIDTQTLETVAKKSESIEALSRAMAGTLVAGRNIYLCGCGATGRLALACETIWRQDHSPSPLRERVIGFMAGGDTALVRAAENFEDHPEYGERQLTELGFTEGDLLIACTEGGETPFVIGATTAAAVRSTNAPFFLYCNPDDILRRTAERCAAVLDNSRIRTLNLTVGPMALAGSTRMQATTALMTAVGVSLLNCEYPKRISSALQALLAFWKGINPATLGDFVRAEADSYARGDYLMYSTDAPLAVTVLTDTAERAPTFSVHPFENSADPSSPLSLCYCGIHGTQSSELAWHAMLGRAPRTVDGNGCIPAAMLSRMYGFDISAAGLARRSGAVAPHVQHIFEITNTPHAMTLSFGGVGQEVPAQGIPMLFRHLALKMLLNAHSTLVMGRLGRYDGNIMTWVRPSNNKLIDRAIRYAEMLLKRRGVHPTYETIALECFKAMETMANDESLVRKVVDRLARPT